MRRIASLVVICLSVALPHCASADDLAHGMSEREVLSLMGPPDAARLERNGVVCLTYALHEHLVWSHLFGQRRRVITLKETDW